MKFPTLRSLLLLGLLISLFVVGLLTTSQSVLATDIQAKSQLSGPDITGTLLLTQGQDGLVRVRGTIQGKPTTLTPGKHGFHIHAVGACEPNTQTAFSSAGGHFDPGPFGSQTPVEANHPYHLGDVPNLIVDAQGKGTYDHLTSRVTLADGPLNLFDSDGSAIIVHKLPDQEKAGGTAADAGGARLACGIITKS